MSEGCCKAPSSGDSEGGTAYAGISRDFSEECRDATGAGSITTKPFEAFGGSLRINADASRGQIKAEVIDAETQQALAGQSSSFVTRDDLDAVVVENIAADRPVRVRFTLNDASLYSFWVAPHLSQSVLSP